MPPRLWWHPLALAAELWGRLRALIARGALDRELNEEIRFHLDMEVERHMAAGLSQVEARRRSLISFGGVDRMSEAHRDARGVRIIEDTLADLEYAAHILARRPLFVAVCVLTLAIATAAGTVLFTGANAFLYRSLPVPGGDKLLSIFTSDFSDRAQLGASSYPDLIDFARDAEPVADIAGESRLMLAFEVHGDVVYVQGAIVSSRYFAVVGVAPALGRFPPAAGAEQPSIVLSHALWRRTFGEDSSLVGSTVRVNGEPFRVAAIAPPEFRGTRRVVSDNFWVDGGFSPLLLHRDDMLHLRTNRSFHVVGRLRDGATLDGLRARLALVASRLFESDPEAWRDASGASRVVTVVRERDANLATIPRTDRLLILGGVIALGLGILVVSCANLASLQAARGAARRREIATRLALGADRGRIIRQLLAESALVAVPGIAAGVALALIVWHVIARSQWIPIPSLDAWPDWRTVGFIVGTLLFALVAFGLLPALQTARADMLTDIKGVERRGAHPLRIGGVRGGLIVTQVALSVVFTATAGLTAFALVRTAREGRGDASKVLVTRVNFLPAAGDSAQVRALVDDLLGIVRGIPGVEAVSAAAFIPTRGARRTVTAETRDASGEVKRRLLDTNHIRAGYFDVMGIPLLQGRDFDPRDRGGPVVIVSSAMAGALWPEGGLGRSLVIDPDDSRRAVSAEVIGIVADLPGERPATDQSYPGLLYLPLGAQAEAEMVLHVRAPTRQRAIVDRMALQFRQFTSRIVASRATTLDDYLDTVELPYRILAGAAAGIAAVQLLLATAGLSGLVGYVTALRRREIGIRRALGASRWSVLVLVMRQGIRLTLIGSIVGLALSVVAARIIGDSLTVTAPILAGGMLIAAVTLAIVGTTAMLVPARRALAVHPATALRAE